MRNVVTNDELLIFDASKLTSNLQKLNPLGLGGPAFLVRIINASNVLIELGINGALFDVVGSKETYQLNFQINANSGSKVAKLAKGTVFQVAKSVVTKGNGYIYLATYY